MLERAHKNGFVLKTIKEYLLPNSINLYFHQSFLKINNNGLAQLAQKNEQIIQMNEVNQLTNEILTSNEETKYKNIEWKIFQFDLPFVDSKAFYRIQLVNIKTSDLQQTCIINFTQIQKKMKILRNIQKEAPLSPSMQVFFIHLPELQLLYIYMVSLNIPFYKEILDIAKVESKFAMQILVIGQLLARTFILTVLGLRYFSFTDKKSPIEILVLKFLKLKIKILIVISLNWNTLAFKQCDTTFAAIALFNLAVTIGELLLTRILNSSYRFEQENLICQKNTSLVIYMMLFPIIYLMDHYDLFYASCLIIFRCLIQIFMNFNNVENRAIQYCDYFSPLVMMNFCIIQILSHFSGVNVLGSHNPIFFMVIFLFTMHAAHCLTETLMVVAPKYHWRKSSYFIKTQDEKSFLQDQGTTAFNEDEQENFVIALRVLAKVYVTKQKAQGLFKMKQNPYHPSPQNSEQFNSWWQEFNHIIINHRVFCTKVTCQCLRLGKDFKQNSIITSDIFLQIMFDSLQKVISRTHSSKLLIIEKYFYLELLQKPIKNYYQLIKLKSIAKKSQQLLELDALMVQTRQIFGHLLNKQKAKHQQIEINQLLNFQDSLREMKLQFVQLSIQYNRFYDLFGNVLVEMPLLRKINAQLMKVKTDVGSRIHGLMKNYSKNLQFLSYCLIYYKYFDEYNDNMEKIQSKINNSQEFNRVQSLGFQSNVKKQIDIFDQIYGAIKIDLVQKPGEMVGVTKNICALLGYKQNEVQGQKVNKIMPYMFSKYHNRYLKKFIEKGSIGILRQKKRIFYARNSQKFILPITVRLKVEYLTAEGFYANSLIQKTPTKSEFILLNNYGKIEQISQKLYRLLFQKSFKDEISKIKRINVFKMLLSLNHFVMKPQQMDERIIEGVITTAKNKELLLSYYKLLELGIDKNKKKGENTSNDPSEDGLTNLTRAGTLNLMGDANFGSQYESKNTSEATYDPQKCKTDMKETLKDFFSRIDLNQIKAYKILYKFYDMVTSEFSYKVLEIVSIQDQISSEVIKVQLSKQISEIRELYGLSEDDVNKLRSSEMKAKREEDIFAESLQNFMHPLQRRIGSLLDDFDNGDNSMHKVFDSFISREKQMDQEVEIEKDGSVGSKGSNAQKLQSKSVIITSFDLKLSLNPKLQSILMILILLVVLSLTVICIFSITLQPDYKNLQKDNLIANNFRISLELQMAVQELQRFYKSFSIEVPSFVQQTKNLLAESMKQQLVKSVKWIDADIGGRLYFGNMKLVESKKGFEETSPVIAMMNKMYSMFVMNQYQPQYISDNYLTIRQNFEYFSEQQKLLIITASSGFRSKIHAIIGIYSSLLVAILVIFATINHSSKQKQHKIIEFLPFFSIKQIRQKNAFYKELVEYMKQTEQILMPSIDHIEQQSLTQQTLKHQESKKKINMIDDPFFINSKKTQPNTAKRNTGQRFIRVIKGEENNLTFKNCLMVSLLVYFCMAVVGSTEYLFGQAHSKFLAYVELKESAMMIGNLAPKTLLTYLININKLIESKPAITFPAEYYHQPIEQLFDLRLKLAMTGNNGSELGEAINEHFNRKICELVSCSGQSKINQTDAYYLTYRFVNAMEYLEILLPSMLEKSTLVKEDIRKWMVQGNVEQLLLGIEHVLELMTKNQQEITDLFSQQITLICFSLLYVSITLIPLLILSLYFIRQKFFNFVYQRLSSIENVYKQFAWNILSENTYAVNYFKNKLRNSKQY